MAIENSLFSEMVNKAIQIKTANNNEDDLKIIENVFKNYETRLGDLSEDEKGELSFQVAYSLINAFR
jgi:hypothetical protein